MNPAVTIKPFNVQHNDQDFVEIHEGYHSYANICDAERSKIIDFISLDGLTIVECIIPKGTTYYTGLYVEYSGLVG